MSDTPLSDLLNAIRERPEDENAFRRFCEAFLDSSIGVTAAGVPAGRPGERFVTGPEHKISLPLVGTPDGRTMIKACADVAAFVRKFPDTKITAMLRGRELLRIMLMNARLDGVLVCSAASLRSIPISRAIAAQLLGPPSSTASASRPWWKFWG